MANLKSRISEGITLVIEACGGWFSAMSGLASIPLALIALIIGGSPKLWFAILAYVSLWVLVIGGLRRNRALLAQMQGVGIVRRLSSQAIRRIQSKLRVAPPIKISVFYKH